MTAAIPERPPGRRSFLDPPDGGLADSNWRLGLICKAVTESFVRNRCNLVRWDDATSSTGGGRL